MRKITSMLAAAAVAVCFAGEVSAQGRGQQGRGGMAGGGMFGGGSVYSLISTNKDLQAELKITEEQLPKIAEVAKAQQAKMAEAFPRPAAGGGGTRPTAEEMKERAEKMAKFAAEGKKAYEAVLTTEQAARASQINIQYMGIRAFSNAEVQTSLKMTDDQKESVKSIMETYQKDVMELGGGGRGGFQRGGAAPSEEDKKKAEENTKKREALTKDTEEKIVAKLTDDQKKIWTGLVGTKFDVAKLRTGPMTARPRDN